MNEKEQSIKQQSGEQTGMSKPFAENSSMELLNNRRIDQIVARKEAERNAIAEGMAGAENRGIQVGVNRGREEGFLAGHNVGLEGGFERGKQYSEGRFSGNGLGNGLGNLVNQQTMQSQPQEPEIINTQTQSLPLN